MNFRLDAAATAWFKRQVEYIRTKTYDTKYKKLMATEAIPVSTEVPSAARYITHYVFTKVGIARILSGYNSKDFPAVDTYATEVEKKVHDVGDKYSYNIRDIETAQMAGTNLDARRAALCKQANDERIDDLAWNGDSNYNINGFFDYPGITSYTLTTGTGGFLWTQKTGDEIIFDLTNFMDAVNVPTNGREIVDTILLPRAQFNLIKNKRMEGNSIKTVYMFFKENNPGVEVMPINELDGAGAGGADRMMAYVRDPDHLVMDIPKPFTQSEPQQDGMEYNVFCISRYGGVTIFYPLSVAYSDGI